MSYLPPILVEIQQTVDQKFMPRLAIYSGKLFQYYKIYSIVLVFCVGKTSRNVLSTFDTFDEPDYMYIMHLGHDKLYTVTEVYGFRLPIAQKELSNMLLRLNNIIKTAHLHDHQ